MKIVYTNYNKELKNIIQTKAKYQKVMLIFDDEVSNIEINNLYEDIKGICVYNQMNAKNIDVNELYNGYKLIIYLCSTDSFINLNFDNAEFVNVFMPTDNGVLPFFLNVNNQINLNNNYLFLKNDIVDINILSSIYFNKFFNYFLDMFEFKTCKIDFDFSIKEITKQSCINMLENINQEIIFKDIEILKKIDIQYNDLQLIHLIIINAFLLLFNRIKNKTYMLVDVYKIAKNDLSIIDKIYAMATNQTFLDLINLNYNCLYSAGKQTKEKILELFNLNVENNYIEEIIKKIKNITKNDSGILAYLYLYEIFEN